MFRRQIDLRSRPVDKIVALGESTTWDYSVSSSMPPETLISAFSQQHGNSPDVPSFDNNPGE